MTFAPVCISWVFKSRCSHAHMNYRGFIFINIASRLNISTEM